MQQKFVAGKMVWLFIALLAGTMSCSGPGGGGDEDPDSGTDGEETQESDDLDFDVPKFQAVSVGGSTACASR